METITLHGTDERLYRFLAPLVMDPGVIRYNNNYPFKTTDAHTWYICLDGNDVAGFIPAKNTPRGIHLDNYYIRDDDPAVLGLLICRILDDASGSVTALCHKRHSHTFGLHGFVTTSVLAKYDKMLHDK